MPQYELMYLVGSNVSDDQVPQLSASVLKFAEDFGGSNIKETQLGKKKLAYPIQKKTTGFYHLIEFAGEGEAIVGNLEVAYKRDERILRFLTVARDKHATAYADKRKGLMAESRAKKKETATS